MCEVQNKTKLKERQRKYKTLKKKNYPEVTFYTISEMTYYCRKQNFLTI